MILSGPGVRRASPVFLPRSPLSGSPAPAAGKLRFRRKVLLFPETPFSVLYKKDRAERRDRQEIDGCGEACQPRQKAEEMDAGGDADPETSAGKEPKQEAGGLP